MHKYPPKFFKIEERGLPDKYGRRWKFIVDKTGTIWGLCWTYRSAKQVIKLLTQRYRKELEKRGTFSLEELQRK